MYALVDCSLESSSSNNRGTISSQHRPPMYHLTPVLKAMTLSPIRAIIHQRRPTAIPPSPLFSRRAQKSGTLCVPGPPSSPSILPSLLARITDRAAARGARNAPRVKLLSPRIRIRQLRIRPGHGRFGDLKRRGEKRGEGSAVEPRG